MYARRPVTTVAMSLALFACRARHRTHAETPAVTGDVPPAPDDAGVEAVPPTRAIEGTQPRWRYLARGARPRGIERWRVDLTPREPSGEPATDGRTVYVSATRDEPEGMTDGEVFAYDLRDGTLRWHTPVGGLHGAPVELLEGVVLVDTIPYCVRRGAATPGVTTRPCEETAPGGVVGLDAVTGRARFRTSASSDVVRASWTAVPGAQRAWIHDDPLGVRPLTLATGALGPRLVSRGAVDVLSASGSDLVYVARSPLGATKLLRVTPGVARPRWERVLPLHTRCPMLTLGPLLVLPAFQSPTVTGAARAIRAADGTDAWATMEAPQRVSTCALIEGASLYQVCDDAIVVTGAGDGRARARRTLPVNLSGEVAVLMDGVMYLSAPSRLVGVDVVGGHVSVSLETGAARVEGVVLWGGRGVALTRTPGLVLGFE